MKATINDNTFRLARVDSSVECEIVAQAYFDCCIKTTITVDDHLPTFVRFNGYNYSAELLNGYFISNSGHKFEARKSDVKIICEADFAEGIKCDNPESPTYISIRDVIYSVKHCEPAKSGIWLPIGYNICTRCPETRSVQSNAGDCEIL